MRLSVETRSDKVNWDQGSSNEGGRGVHAPKSKVSPPLVSPKRNFRRVPLDIWDEKLLPSLLWHCWLGVKKLSDRVLAWLSVWSVVQMICIWSSNWCHCHPISCFRKIQNGLPFWCQLTQVVLGKRQLNVCVYSYDDFFVKNCIFEHMTRISFPVTGSTLETPGPQYPLQVGLVISVMEIKRYRLCVRLPVADGMWRSVVDKKQRSNPGHVVLEDDPDVVILHNTLYQDSTVLHTPVVSYVEVYRHGDSRHAGQPPCRSTPWGALQHGRVGAHPKFWLGGPQCIWPHE